MKDKRIVYRYGFIRICKIYYTQIRGIMQPNQEKFTFLTHKDCKNSDRCYNEKINEEKEYAMNIHFKRFLCILLVVCLMITLPGCTAVGELVGGLWYFARTGVYLLSYIVIIPAMWVVDQLTWSFVEFTGFNVNALGNKVCQRWTALILPENLRENGWWGGWFVIRDEEELEAKLRKGGHLKDGESLDDKILEEVLGYVPGAEEVPEEEETPGAEEEGEISTTTVTMPPVYGDSTIPTEIITFPEEESLVPGKDEAVLHYELHGGYNAPKDHLIKVSGFLNSVVNVFAPAKFPDTVPVKPGYHFLGWVIPGEMGFDGEVTPETLTGFVRDNWNDAKELLHQPGDKISKDTRGKMETRTTLHAVWFQEGSGDSHMIWNHKFTVKQEKNSHVVTVKCSCGMTINDESISFDEFRRCCESGSQNLSEREMIRLYRLFKAQHIGYLALYFNGMFYTESPDYAGMFSTVEEIAGLFEEVEPVVKHYASRQYTSEADKELVEEVFEDIAGVRDSITGAMEKVSFAISLWQTGKSIHQMLDSDGGIISQTVGMLDTVDAISSYLGVDAIASPVVEVLKTSMEAIDALARSNRKYEFALSAGDNSFPADHDYLNQIFSDSRTFGQAVQELTFGGGCQCSAEKGTDGCNFSYHSGMALHRCPDTFEIVRKMEQVKAGTLLRPVPEEKEFLMFYLAERSRHDLYQLTGMTLEEYNAMLKSLSAYDQYVASGK